MFITSMFIALLVLYILLIYVLLRDKKYYYVFQLVFALVFAGIVSLYQLIK